MDCLTGCGSYLSVAAGINVCNHKNETDMRILKLSWLVPVLLLAACEAGVSETSYEAAPAAKETVAVKHAAAAPVKGVPVERKVLRTADLRCNVADVVKVSAAIERTVTAAGGYIEDSKVDNQLVSDKTVAYKPDSVRRVQVYHASAVLRLRVPAARLDSVVGMLPALAEFVEERRLAQEDATLRYWGNELLNAPAGDVKQVRVNGQEALALNRYTDEQREKRVTREIENLDIEQRAALATLMVTLNQPEVTRVTVLPETSALEETPFGTRCYAAVKDSLDICKEIFLLCLSLWPLLAMGAAIYFVVRKVRRRQRRSVTA